ncbi:hypothetical protein Ahy_A09g046399 isoform B [Arachis hypogaea]|uniref:Uncharacterized protein n=1 Tax=Arachis hypogaea TaxID=3818 RepID=A0A445BPN5_ARAHY|nr:hypothetical protein Ahy_A09g046399 isoform B [Arachis hypogaea]
MGRGVLFPVSLRYPKKNLVTITLQSLDREPQQRKGESSTGLLLCRRGSSLCQFQLAHPLHCSFRSPVSSLSRVAPVHEGHSWVQEGGLAPDKPLDSTVLSRLKQFSAMNKLKKIAI